MKIVSVLLFAVAMIGSWMAVNSRRPVAESVHAGIQDDLKKIIAEYVQKNLPNSKNLRFHRFYTENVNENRVRALFMYSFEDQSESGEMAEVILEGSAVLNKAQETPEVITWNFDELKISGNTVNFSEPIQITAERGAKTVESPSEPNPSKQENHN